MTIVAIEGHRFVDHLDKPTSIRRSSPETRSRAFGRLPMLFVETLLHAKISQLSVRLMNLRSLSDKKHQFRAVLCGHKAVEAGTVCVLLMVQGHLGAIAAAHLVVASKTGLLATIPVLAVSFTRHARHFANRWTTSAILGVSAFLADAVVHRSHYPGEYSEAALTGLGAFAFSVAISYTPLGKRIDRMAESFLHDHRMTSTSVEPQTAGGHNTGVG